MSTSYLFTSGNGYASVIVRPLLVSVRVSFSLGPPLSLPLLQVFRILGLLELCIDTFEYPGQAVKDGVFAYHALPF